MVRPAGVFSNRYKVDDIPDQTGKVAIVVGGSRGIGEQVTQALVQKGCHGESSARLDSQTVYATTCHLDAGLRMDV